MLNISELTSEYIQKTYTPELQPIILTAFKFIDEFGLNFYEDKYITLVTQKEYQNSDTVQDHFIQYLRNDLILIIQSHGITLDLEMEIHLTVLLDIVGFLLLIQNQENYFNIEGRLYSDDHSRFILIDIISYVLNDSDKDKYMRVISDVTDGFIVSLKKLVEAKTPIEKIENRYDVKLHKAASSFFKFTNRVHCLGLHLYDISYEGLDIKDLVNIVPWDFKAIVDKNIPLDVPQATLDVLSTLMICSDTYEDPITKFREHSGLFTDKLDNITILDKCLLKMIGDYNNYLEAMKIGKEQQ